MTVYYKGGLQSALDGDGEYFKLAKTGFLSVESTSKADVLKRLLSVSNDLPLGTIVRIEKIYRMTRGYEPSKPRTGTVLDTAYLQLKERDPRNGSTLTRNGKHR